MNRKTFLQYTAATAASMSVPFAGYPSLLAQSKTKTPAFSLLLGTVEQLMKTAPRETLKKIAALGYQGLEYPGTFDLPAGELKAMIVENNLVSVGGGYSMSLLLKNFSSIVTGYQAMGKNYVLCYWPWVDNGKNKTVNDWKVCCDGFNDLGRRFKKEGLRLEYHNHNIEFVKPGSRYLTILY